MIGVILCENATDFVPDMDNLKVMHRPLSTMGMVGMLNGTYDDIVRTDGNKVYKPDFTAPDAKVLVVDDNKINLTIAEGLMLPLKLQIDTADGGQEAIDKVAANEYDIVFMDHMMPEIDGVDATKRIRGAGEGSHQPVIVALSANVMGEAKTLFTEAGMNDFVGKPIDVRKLSSTIKKWLPPEKIVEKTADGGDDADNEDEVIVKIDGLDIDNAVRALGSVPLYNKIVGEYYRSGEDKLNSIKEAYDKEDWTDYTIKVHALKSSSRQIGAMELGRMAAELEEAGKDNNIDKIKADTGAALDVFRNLLTKLAEFYETGEEEDTDKPLVEKDVLLELLAEMETACDDLDLDTLEEIDNKLKGYSYEETTKEEISRLHKAVADIDTDDCMEIIKAIRSISA